MSGTERLRVALDTNAIIELFERASRASDQLSRVVAVCRARGLPVVVSELALAEVLVVPVRTGRADDVADCTRLFSANDAFDVRPVDRDVLVTSERLKASNAGSKLPDAIHAATAFGSGEVFLTSDQRLARIDWSVALASAAAPDRVPAAVDPVSVDIIKLVESQ